MNKIIKKVQFSEKVFLFEIEAPLIAKSRKAGNFVIVRVGENGERMPLTIADADIEKGTITIVVQEVGLSSTKLCNLNEGDFITDVVGPLGNPTHIEKFGTVICAGGGVGVAPMLPIIKALKAAGNRVLSVLAGRNKDLIILEDEVRKNSDEVIIMTDGWRKGCCHYRHRKAHPAGTHRQGVCHWPSNHDEVLLLAHTEIQHSYRRLSQYHHGRRHWYVWCLPTHHWWQNKVRMYRWS